jgi:hypothetical protein
MLHKPSIQNKLNKTIVKPQQSAITTIYCLKHKQCEINTVICKLLVNVISLM